MRRFKLIKDLVAKVKKYAYLANESIRWITNADIYVVKLQIGECSIGVIGRRGVINDLVQIFSSNDPLPVLGPLRRWNCLQFSKALGVVDIFFGEIPPWASVKEPSQFLLQPLIDQRIKIEDGFDAFFAEVDLSQRARFEESISVGDTIQLGNRPEEIESFYTNFLLTSTTSRHGSCTSIPPLQMFLDLATENCLLHIKDKAGVIQFTAFIQKSKNSEWRVLRSGLSRYSLADNHRKSVLLARANIEAVRFAVASGQKSLSLGLCLAAAGSGIFRYTEDFSSSYSNDFLAYPRLLGTAQTDVGVEKLEALQLLVRPSVDPSKIMHFEKAKAIWMADRSKDVASLAAGSRVLSTFLQLGFASAITSVLGLALKIALPRILGTNQIGQLYFAESVAAIFFGFMPLGIAAYISREIPKNPESSGLILGTVIPFQLLWAVILTLCMYVFLYFSGANIIAQQCGLAFAVCAGAMVLQRTIVGRAYLALGKSAVVAANEIWTRLLLVAIIAIVLFESSSAVSVAWSYAIAHVIGFLLLIRKSYANNAIKWSTDFFRFKEIVWTSLPFFAVSALIEIYGNIDIAMLNYLSNSDEVAFYGSANKLKGAALFFLPIFQAAVQPALAQTWFENREKFGSLVSQAMRVVVAMSLPIVIVMVLVPDFLATTLFGAQFVKSSLAIACVAPILTLSSLNVLMGSCLNVISNGVSFLAVTTISVLMNVLLNTIAISYAVREFGPGAGAAAAAIATVVSETFVLVAMHRIFKVGLDQKRMWLILLAAVAPCLAIGAYFQALQSVNPYLRLIVAAFLVPIYMYIVKLVRPDDIRWIINSRRKGFK